MHRRVVAFIALGLLATVDANAQTARPPAPLPPRPRSAVPAPVPVPRTDFIKTMDIEFQQMDADKNNRVTRTEVEQFQRSVSVLEAQNRVRALFAQLDTDKNGQLSAAEFSKMAVTPPAPNPTPVMSQADLNRDGSITLVEYRTAKLANFDRMDTDKDGIVSVAEMRAAGIIK